MSAVPQPPASPTPQPSDREQVADLGWQCLLDEWAFNDRAGFTAADDDLPACMKEEGVGPNQVMKFDVPASIIAEAKRKMPYREELFAIKATG